MLKIKKYDCPDPPDPNSRYAQIIRMARMTDCERGKMTVIVVKLSAKAKAKLKAKAKAKAKG